MKDRMAAWWRKRDGYDMLSILFILACVILILVNLSMYPVYLDIPYHMAVTRGFQEAGGVTTWDFWDYAPQGRPQIYPPLLHVGMSMLQDMGLSAEATATLVCVMMFPLILLSLWWAMRKLFGSRAAFYALVLVGVPYAFFYQTGITIAASLVLALTPLVFLALEEDRKLAAALLLAMCLYSHLILGHLVALALFIYMLHRREAWKKILTVLVAAYILYLPWGIVVLSNLSSFTASEPGLGSDFALHLLLWGSAAAGFVVCYFRKKQYYLLPSYLLSMVPIAFFYSHRFWEGHVFLPLAMLGGVALDRLHAFLKERLSRRTSTAAYAKAAAGLVLGGLILLVFFADPVLASSKNGPATGGLRGQAGAAPGPGAQNGMYPPLGSGGTPFMPPGQEGYAPPGREGLPAPGPGAYPQPVPGETVQQGPPYTPAQPPGGDKKGYLSPGEGRMLPRRPLQRLQDLAGDSLSISLRPTTIPVLLGLEEAQQNMAGAQEVFSEENHELMSAIEEYSEPGDVVFTPDGRLGDLVYALTGRYATQGMFHEVQPEEQPDPLQEADMAVIPAGIGAAAGDAATGRGDAATGRLEGFMEEEGWSEVGKSGRYTILVHEDPSGADSEASSAALPLWAAYALLLAAAAAILVDMTRRRPGRWMPGGPDFIPPEDPPGKDACRDNAVIAVVPAHNEEENVGDVVSEIRRNCPGLDVLVIDDGSSDGTGKAALEAGAMVLSLKSNMGVGEAERRGLAYAYSRGYAYAVRLDGDGQHPASCIIGLLAPLCSGEANVVVGSRFLAGSGLGYSISRSRRLGMAYFRAILRLSTSLRFSDPTSGCRSYSRQAMYLLSHVEPPRYPEVTSLRLLASGGLVVREVPVEVGPRRNGQSSIRMREALSMAVEVTLDLLHPPAPRGCTRPEEPILA